MLDVKYLLQHSDVVLQKLCMKDPLLDLHDIFLKLKNRKVLQQTIETVQSKRGVLSSIKQDESAYAEAVLLREQSAELDKQISKLDKEIKNIMDFIPNIPDDDVPIGSVNNNVILKEKMATWNQEVHSMDHVDIAQKLGIIDFARGAKISGSKWHIYTGKGALLEFALIKYFVDILQERGLNFILPPLFVNEKSMFGCGNLPKFSDQLYKDQKENLYAIPTAEVPLVALHTDEILLEHELPLWYCAYTPCFRKEVGARSSEKGLLRTHQFNKVEMVSICTKEQSEKILYDMVYIANYMLDSLGLCYRNTMLATEEISFSATKTIDIEVFISSQNKFIECSSISSCSTFQSRRLNIRYKPENKSSNQFVYTLNGSGLATSRLLASILETYYVPSKGLIIPEVLRKYTDFDVISNMK